VKQGVMASWSDFLMPKSVFLLSKLARTFLILQLTNAILLSVYFISTSPREAAGAPNIDTRLFFFSVVGAVRASGLSRPNVSSLNAS
jgi:hypothetical protein